jgi:23S rRNA (guanine2445-N2)-methyltransferase / 23S rRNA (guanine2069-N7)-methyltransferase
VDWYEGRWLHVQEFAPPGKIPREKSRQRLNTLIAVLKELTGCSDENLYLKTRERGIRPYGKMGENRDRFIIRENGMRFYVNFTDYLDTGIFLDHRPTRLLIRDIMSETKDGRFLNLFAYTGTASVMAAAGGAVKTVSVDVSNTYLNWSKDNMKLNRLDSSSHSFIRSDSFDFLKNNRSEFSLIFIDPPTYSNGTGRRDWSVQEDHASLIQLAMEHLRPDGILLFSENLRRFKLDRALEGIFSLREITRETTDPDFVRRSGAHRCWEISHRR